MMTRRMWLWSALLALPLAFVTASPAYAEISRMSVHVDGMACPFCVFNLEKRLKPLRNVEGVKTNLKTGNVTLVVGKGQGPTPAEIQQAVRKAGFTPGTMGLTAIGTLALRDDYILLNVRSVGNVKPAYETFYLFQTGQGNKFFDEKTRAQLEQLAGQNALVAITGSVHEHAEGLPALSADEIKVVPKENDAHDGNEGGPR